MDAHTGRVVLALALALMLSLPFLVPGICSVVRREWEQIVEQRCAPSAAQPAIERVAADLRRLRLQLELRENQPGSTGKGMRMGALRAAYVEVLCTACRQLDVRPPEQLGQLQQFGQLRPSLAEIYRVESELRARGLDVRTSEWSDRVA